MSSHYHQLLFVSCFLCTTAQFVDDMQVYQHSCLGERFQCLDGGCISQWQYCDGNSDCIDGSDEEMCANHTPEPATCEQLNQFPCADGKKCVPHEWVCNGVPECEDASDELNCTRLKIDTNSECKGFKCGDGRCISLMWVCDGVYDCADKSDESPNNCKHPRRTSRYDLDDQFCEMFEFDRMLRDEDYVYVYRCLDNSTCLQANYMCNGLVDCRDGSDEGPFCNNWSTMCSNITCGDRNATCVPTRNGPACKCTERGYGYNDTSRMCFAQDTCKLAVPACSQKCEWHGKPAHFLCRCDPGYKADSLKIEHICFAPDPEGLLFFTTQNDIRYLTLKTRQRTVVATGIKQAHGVTYDGKFVYWVETARGHQSIVRGRLENTKSSKETLVSIGLEDVGDLALDWMGGHIYFSDAERGVIAACTTDGAMCTTVLKRPSVHVPRFITLDPKNGQMFWVDWRDRAVIVTSRMDGSDVRVLVAQVHGSATGLAYDEPGDRLYFADSAIRGVKVDDGQIYTVTRDRVHHPYALAVFENSVYWSDWSSNSILASDKASGTMNVFVPYQVNTTVFGMHIYHPILMDRAANPCKKHNCSHMCLVTSNHSNACACPEGMELNGKHHCQDIEGYRPQYLVVGAGSYFTRIQYDRLGNPEYHATQFDIARVQATAYDSFTDTLYIYDGTRKTINYVNMSDFTLGVTQTLVYDGLDDVVDMDYDYASDSLYVLDAGRSFVEVISLRSQKRALLYRFELETPVSLCVIPEYGMMLVAVAGNERDVYIDTFGLDGSDRTHIVKTNLKGPQVRLRYSHSLDNVFIADEGSSTIAFMHHTGKGREVYRELSTSVTSLAVTDTYAFWTDKRSSRLYWSDVHEATPRIRRIDLALFPNNTRLHLQVTTPNLDPNLPLLFHHCRSDPCTDVCVQVPHEYQDPKGYKCLCAPGLMAVNGKCSEIVHCKYYEGYCHKSNQCFDKKGLCDRIMDCPKGEDEEGCIYPPQPSCSPQEVLCNGYCMDADKVCRPEKKSDALEECKPHEFTCKAHAACVARRLVCDGHRDCPDGSDEAAPTCDTFTCLDLEFMCSIGSCVLNAFKCDGDWDCLDGSDELGCFNKSCAWGQFSCRNGQCVELRKRCDRRGDCSDGSDEEDCEEEELFDANQEEPENCPEWEVPCELDRSICIPFTARCNHKTECPGGTDELGCMERCHLPGYHNCKEDAGCFPLSKFCDGKKDCEDGSDESAEACSMANKTSSPLYPIVSPNEGCAEGFRCADGQCVDWRQVCDNATDCHDGSDENGSCLTACENSTCDFTCQATPAGAVCRCPEGYQRQDTLHACVNKNECLRDVCSQQCYDVEGSYVCGCHHGYALRADRHSCKATKGNMAVYYVTANSVRSIVPGGRVTVEYNDSSIGSIADIDVDVRHSELYVASLGDGGKLVAVSSTLNVTVTNIGQPTKVSVDWITGNVYFVDATPSASHVRVCHVKRRRCAVLNRLPSAAVVTDLIVEPASRRMYYCVTKDMESTVWAASLAGDRATELGTLPGCSGLAADSFARRLYVAQAAPPKILRMPLVGGGHEEYIANDTNLDTPQRLAIFEDHVYFLVANSFKLNRCRIYGRKTCELYLQRVFDANTFVLRHESVQRDDIPNFCSGFDCDNLCVVGENGPQCLCDDGSVSKTGRCPMVPKNQLPRFNGRTRRDFADARPRTVPAPATLAISGALLLAAALAVFAYYRLHRGRLRRAAPYVPVHFQNKSADRDTEGLLPSTSLVNIPISPSPSSVHFQSTSADTEGLLPISTAQLNIPVSSSQRRIEFVNPLQLIRNTWRRSFRKPLPVGTAGLFIDSPFAVSPATSPTHTSLIDTSPTDTSQLDTAPINTSDTESDLDDKETRRRY